MDDYGIGAAARAGLEVYASASRGSGRTHRLLASLRGGELVVCATAAEAEMLQRRLEAFRPDVLPVPQKIRFVVPRWSHPGDVVDELGGRRGPVVFTAGAVERAYREAMDSVADGLARYGAERLKLETEPPPRDVPPVGRWK